MFHGPWNKWIEVDREKQIRVSSTGKKLEDSSLRIDFGLILIYHAAMQKLCQSLVDSVRRSTTSLDVKITPQSWMNLLL